MSTDMMISPSDALITLPTPISMSSSGTVPTTAATTASAVAVLSKCTIYPDRMATATATLGHLPLSVSDLPMLSCNYIQKGLFFPPPPMPMPALLSLLASSLSRALSLFPPLAGRLATLPDHRIVIACDDVSGVEFSYAVAPSLSLSLLLPSSSDIPAHVRSLFPLDGAISFHGHFLPLAAFQVTELGDGAIFVGAAVNHSVTDGTSFWNFFNVWAELCRGGAPEPPNFRRNYFGGSTAVLRFPDGRGPEVSFSSNAPLRERIFCFSAEAIAELKTRANRTRDKEPVDIDGDAISEILGKQVHDPKATAAEDGEISSFQSLCAHIWRSVTRARINHLPPEAKTTFRMAVNCRSRVVPKVADYYFGNAIQSIPTVATVKDVTSKDHRWVAALLHRSVVRHDDGAIKRAVAEWENSPACFPLGNPNGAGLTMGSSPRFPMYDGNDFGWGRPVAVRSGRANKFDGKMSAFPGREGGGSTDVEVCLAPDTMATLLQDEEFMSYVSDQ